MKSRLNVLAVRWGVFALVIDVLIIILSSLILGHVPAANWLRVTPHSGLVVPHVSRLFDPLVVMVPVIFMAREFLRPHDSDRYFPKTFGLLFGLCGSVLIAVAGWNSLAVATLICAGLVSLLLVCGEGLWEIVLIEGLAILIIWAIETMGFGVVVGGAYALSVALITLAVNFIAAMIWTLVIAIAWIFRAEGMIVSFFRRTMLE